MEPVSSLATTVISILSRYLAKGAEEFVESARKDAYDKARKILIALKTRWAGDEEARDELERFEQKPVLCRPVLQQMLQERLVGDNELVRTLTELLKEMGPSIEIVQKIEEAEETVGLEVGEMGGGRARIESRSLQSVGRRIVPE